MRESDLEALTTYYRSLAKRNSAAGKCAMSVPASLEGKRVLEVCCRSGKGAYEISDHVGAGGVVMGVDADAERIERARINAPANHAAGKDWVRSLSFRQAFPETIRESLSDEPTFDVVYINSAINLAFSLVQTLCEFRSVLSPTGYLWVAQGIFSIDAVSSCDAEGSQWALHGGGGDVADIAFANVFARALSVDEFRSICQDVGFADVRFGEAFHVVPDDRDALECLRGRNFVTCDVCAYR